MGRPALVAGSGDVRADAPSKARDPNPTLGRPGAAMQAVLDAMAGASREVGIMSPYFVPGAVGMQAMSAGVRQGVRTTLYTNSLASSDEPLVHYRYADYRAEMLRIGVQIYEFSPELIRRSSGFGFRGPSSAQLHAKVAVVDDSLLVVGSVNLDPRSAVGNAEILRRHRQSTAGGRPAASERGEITACDDVSAAVAVRRPDHRMSQPPPNFLFRWVLPQGVASEALPLLVARALRAIGDGYMAVLLPAYLLAIGLGTLQVGIVSTATMLGSALATLAVGAWGHRYAGNKLLLVAAVLMVATGLGFAGLSSFWPLLVVAFIGTLNPSSGDVSVFLPLEHARLAHAAQGGARTALFARYSVLGASCAAIGALAAGLPDGLARDAGMPRLAALRAMFICYGLLGVAVFWLYRRLPKPEASQEQAAIAPLGPSRSIVVRLAALFSVDAFAGGLVVNSLLSLWLFQRFGLSLSQAGAYFFWAGLLSAASQLAAPVVAGRIGLLNTMVFTHIPANICLILAALAPSLPLALGLLFVRSALSQMDVPTRTAFVMAVVTPAERSAAASFTAVPRSLAAALSPTLSGALFAAGWIGLPLVACGALKIAYDLALWRAMRRHRIDNE